MLIDQCINFTLNYRKQLLFLVTAVLVISLGDAPPNTGGVS